jgi:hypothetical protein
MCQQWAAIVLSASIPTNRHSFIAGARSADNFRAQAPLGRALGCSIEGDTSRREP